MSTEIKKTEFNETSIPMQDYTSRVLGYASVGITLTIGVIIGYFPSNILWVALITLV
jgi:hypothetical protein